MSKLNNNTQNPYIQNHPINILSRKVGRTDGVAVWFIFYDSLKETAYKICGMVEDISNYKDCWQKYAKHQETTLEVLDKIWVVNQKWQRFRREDASAIWKDLVSKGFTTGIVPEKELAKQLPNTLPTKALFGSSIDDEDDDQELEALLDADF
jgi:hypothetical protein